MISRYPMVDIESTTIHKMIILEDEHITPMDLVNIKKDQDVKFQLVLPCTYRRNAVEHAFST